MLLVLSVVCLNSASILFSFLLPQLLFTVLRLKYGWISLFAIELFPKGFFINGSFLSRVENVLLSSKYELALASLASNNILQIHHYNLLSSINS